MKLLFLPLWLISLLCTVCAAALLTVFIFGFSETIPAYILYGVSFYALTTLCIRLYRIIPFHYKKAKDRIYGTQTGNKLMTDAVYRTQMSLQIALIANLAYVGINIISFIDNRSYWFLIFAGYYTVLAVMRYLLVKYGRKNGIGKNRKGELKRASVCSCILLTVNFALSGAVLMMLFKDKGFRYNGILIYVMAMYTFYVTIHAIISLTKYRKYKSPLMTMSKIISLCAALVSMLSLETAMLSEFGKEMAKDNQRLMIALTGAGISIAVISLSVYMIIRSHKELKSTGGKL